MHQIGEFINVKNKRVGYLVGLKINGEVYIGWSLCNESDKYDEKKAVSMAIGRAKKKTPLLSYNELSGIPTYDDFASIDYSFDAYYPPSINKKMKRFVDRCKRYFQTNEVANFQDSVNIKLSMNNGNIYFDSGSKSTIEYKVAVYE